MTPTPSTQPLFPGVFSISFREGDSFNTLCSRLANYNSDRFDAVALRFFYGEETVITIYAHDKLHSTNTENGKKSLPVHKFKILCTVEDFFKEIQQLNFTVSNTGYDMDDMEVTNK